MIMVLALILTKFVERTIVNLAFILYLSSKTIDLRSLLVPFKRHSRVDREPLHNSICDSHNIDKKISNLGKDGLYGPSVLHTFYI